MAGDCPYSEIAQLKQLKRLDGLAAPFRLFAGVFPADLRALGPIEARVAVAGIIGAFRKENSTGRPARDRALHPHQLKMEYISRDSVAPRRTGLGDGTGVIKVPLGLLVIVHGRGER